MLATWPLAAVPATLPGSASEPVAISLQQQLGDPADLGTRPGPASVLDQNTRPGTEISFQLIVDYRCAPQESGRQLFVSIADTAKTADVSKLPAPQPMELAVPWSQIRWLDGAAACQERTSAHADAVGPGALNYFRLYARATAFATLSCAAAGGKTRTKTVTIPLDLWLRCASPVPGPAPEPEQTQDAPAADPQP